MRIGATRDRVFSTRAQVPVGGINEFSSRVEHVRRQGRIRYDLTTSNPTRAEIIYPWTRIKDALPRAPFEHYAPDSLGHIEARRQIAQYLRQSPTLADGFYDVQIGEPPAPERMMLTASTSEAYSYLFKLLCEPGGVVLVPSPSYPLVERLAGHESVGTVTYRLAYDGAWHIDRHSVVDAMQHKPRAIVLVSPNNPTGSCVSTEELDFLSQFGVPLIVDQVFAPYVVRSERGVRLGGPTREPLTFVLDGLSKRCGLPQLKLGWVSVSGRAPEVDATLLALSHLADTYLSVNRPVEAAVAELLEITDDVRSNIRKRLARNWSALATRTDNTSFGPLHYEGGWTAILRLPNFRTDDEWALELLEHGVLVQPGWLYDIPIPATVVVSLLTPELAFDAGIDVLRRLCS